MTARRTLAVSATLAAGALALALSACKREEVAVREPTPPRVQVERIALAPAETARTFVGTVRPRYETDLAFRVAGKVTERTVNVGDRVPRGCRRRPPRPDRSAPPGGERGGGAGWRGRTSSFTQAAADERRYAGLKANGFAALADYDRRKTTRD